MLLNNFKVGGPGLDSASLRTGHRRAHQTGLPVGRGKYIMTFLVKYEQFHLARVQFRESGRVAGDLPQIHKLSLWFSRAHKDLHLKVVIWCLASWHHCKWLCYIKNLRELELCDSWRLAFSDSYILEFPKPIIASGITATETKVLNWRIQSGKDL